MVEPCEDLAICDADQESFKAYLARWLGITIQVAPFTHDLIMPKLEFSAVRAAQTCTGPSQHGSGPYQCGMRWWKDGYDGVGGVGPQMTALNIISVLNAARVAPPYTNSTGGSSQGNPGLGTNDDTTRLPIVTDPATAGDKAGAAFFTMVIVALWCSGAWWMIK